MSMKTLTNEIDQRIQKLNEFLNDKKLVVEKEKPKGFSKNWCKCIKFSQQHCNNEMFLKRLDRLIEHFKKGIIDEKWLVYGDVYFGKLILSDESEGLNAIDNVLQARIVKKG